MIYALYRKADRKTRPQWSTLRRLRPKEEAETTKAAAFEALIAHGYENSDVRVEDTRTETMSH